VRYFLEHDHGSVEITVGVTVVGRSPECQLQFHDESLSRQHCRFILSANDLILEDLKSRNGTFLNGRPLPGRRRVFPGDRVIIGHQQIVIATAEGYLERPPTAEYPHWGAPIEPSPTEEELADRVARKTAATLDLPPQLASKRTPRDTLVETSPFAQHNTAPYAEGESFPHAADDYDEETELDKLICPACGAEVALRMNACTRCGAPLK